VLTPEEAQSLATIEPREVLLAKIAGAAKMQMSRAAYMFQALQSRFLALLEAYREKVPAGESDGDVAGAQAEAGSDGDAEAAAETEPASPAGTEVEEPAPDATVPDEALEEEDGAATTGGSEAETEPQSAGTEPETETETETEPPGSGEDGEE
jgi:hypothetical protein